MKLPFSRKHLAIYGNVSVRFTFVFDMGAGNYQRVASRLLNADIAEVLSRSVDDEVHLSRRFKKLARTRADALAYIDLIEAMAKVELGPLSRRSRYFLWKAFATSRLRFNRSSNKESDLGVRSDNPKAMRAIVEKIDSTMRELRFVPLLQAAIDRDLYQPGYLVEVPFVRLKLRSTSVKFDPARIGQDSGYEAWVRPSLLLHNSGVALLSFDLEYPPGLTGEHLVRMAFGEYKMFSSVTVSEPVFSNMVHFYDASEDRAAGEWEPDIGAGVRWRRIVGQEAHSSVVDLFEMYRDAIYQVVDPPKRRLGSWMCYPSIFVDSLDCCGKRQVWVKNHPLELINLAGRSRFRELDLERGADRLLGRDHSLTHHRSFYANASISIDVNWNFSRERKLGPADHFHRTVIVEDVIIKYWQLRLLEAHLRTTWKQGRSLRKLQRNTIHALIDYGQRRLSYGTAEDISRILSQEMAGELHSHLRDQVDMTNQLVASERTEMVARKANRFAGTALVVAIFLGLPGIRQTLEVLQKAGPPVGDLPIIRSIQSGSLSADLVLWCAYGALVALLGLLFMSDHLRAIVAKIASYRIRLPYLYRWPGQDFRVHLASKVTDKIKERKDVGND